MRVSTARFQKALAAVEKANERFEDEASSIVERVCATLSKRWPRRTLTLFSGNGSCGLTIPGKIRGRHGEWEFELSTFDNPGAEFRDRNGWHPYWNLQLPEFARTALSLIAENDPSRRNYMIIGKAYRTTFHNGRLLKREN